MRYQGGKLAGTGSLATAGFTSVRGPKYVGQSGGHIHRSSARRSALGTLYVVSTPIGNLEDITLRALRILKEVDVIAAEDTRSARKLLTHYGTTARLISFFEGNKIARLPTLLDALDQGDVALLSEAGTPVVSDPGRDLVSRASEQGFNVVVIPGASAVTGALAVSGFNADSFRFLGFLPRRAAGRRRTLANAASVPETLVVFEAPHRLRACLSDMLDAFGDRPIAVCRELTKMYEEVFRGTISQALDYFQEPRGEFTLVLQGAPPQEPQADSRDVTQELRQLRKSGARAREAVSTVSDKWGLSRREAYRLWLSLGTELD